MKLHTDYKSPFNGEQSLNEKKIANCKDLKTGSGWLPNSVEDLPEGAPRSAVLRLHSPPGIPLTDPR